MGAAEHRIGRLVFEFATPDAAAIDQFGEMVRSRFEAVVLPALEAGLDRFDRPGEVIRLGRLEVDLGTLEPAALEAGELTRRIIDGLAAALRTEPPVEQRATAGARDDAAELAAFLETGELSWSEPGRALATLTATLMALDAVGIASLAARIRTVLIRRRAAERLVRQLPAALVRRLLRALLPEALAAPLAAVRGPDRPAIEPPPWASVTEALVPQLTEAIHRLATGTAAVDFGLILTLFAALDQPAAPGFAPSLDDTTLRPDEAETALHAPDAAPSASPGYGLEFEALEPALPDQRPAPDTPELPEDRAEAAGRPVHAAGAVLLHPFVATYFDRVGLLEGSGGFRDGTARARAVLLAHHLATGEAEAPEPDTTLFKLLCGLEISDPVPRRIGLTETEQVEAEALLASVIRHWKRLGKTSPAGLREGFLTRPGRLERRDALWHLSVERRSIDVLLDGLPWMLSRVKTPFMVSALMVDWR